MVLRGLMTAGLAFSLSCSDGRAPEDPTSWFDPGAATSVEESVAFTDQNYDFPTDPSSGIQALQDAVFPVGQWATAFGPDDAWTGNSCETEVDEDLPFEVEGIVPCIHAGTLRPMDVMMGMKSSTDPSLFRTAHPESSFWGIQRSHTSIWAHASK